MSSQQVALALVARLIAAALVQQSLELWQLRRLTGPDGIWRWREIRRDFAHLPAPLRALCDLLLGDPGFRALVLLRLMGACLLLVRPSPTATAPAASLLVTGLLASTVLIALRWRGSFNGGSDFMTLVVLGTLTVATHFADRPTVVAGALLYLAVQSCASYFISGFIKLARPNWRSGRALRVFMASTIFDRPDALVRLLAVPTVAALAAWTVMLLEFALPLALLSRPACLVFGALAITFHVVNFRLFGLNRFVLAWAATWPAIWWCAPLGALRLGA